MTQEPQAAWLDSNILVVLQGHPPYELILTHVELNDSGTQELKSIKLNQIQQLHLQKILNEAFPNGVKQ